MDQLFGPYFSESELGIENAPDNVREKMFLLVKMGLNPIRLKYGPVKITSGYRSPEHNVQIGGVNDSQHLTGEACDILCQNVQSMREVFEWLRTWWPGQLIYYSVRGHIRAETNTWNN